MCWFRALWSLNSERKIVKKKLGGAVVGNEPQSVQCSETGGQVWCINARCGEVDGPSRRTLLVAPDCQVAL